MSIHTASINALDNECPQVLSMRADISRDIFCNANSNVIVAYSLPLPDLYSCSRQQVLEYFKNTWALTEMLFSALKKEDAFYCLPYHQIRHPLIFYYCHVATFYINKCKLAGLINEAINPYFETFFSTGVDEMSWDDMSKNEKSWPLLSEIITYRANVYQKISQVIETHPDFDGTPIIDKDPLWALFMSFEHERIHLETSSVLIRELPNELVCKPKHWPEYYPLVDTTAKQPKQFIDYPYNPLIEVPESQVQIGKPHDWHSYGWDNEYGEKNIFLQPFRANKFLVSNGEFFQFVKNDGYENRDYWSDEGWKWRTFRNTVHPVFWVMDKYIQYKLRLCFEIVPMQWSWPVDVNFHEAKAYCAWRTKHDQKNRPYRLITEEEHYRLRDPMIIDPIMANDSYQMRANKININLAYGSQTPVDANAENRLGFHDLFGNAWEWSESHFSPLPGFNTHYLYPDFSTPCFDEKHNIILGGSFISTGDEASKWARFHFRRHFFQHLGFRMVQSC